MLYLIRRVKDKQVKADSSGKPRLYSLREAQKLLVREYGQTGPRHGIFVTNPDTKQVTCLSEPWTFEFIPFN